jgi:hypothetical protein
MYNEDIPTRAELPTTRQLIRSSIIAFVSAIAILATVILPAEYAIDPTGIGSALGLGEMGEIKKQLEQEAEADRLRDLPNQSPSQPAINSNPDQQSSLFNSIISALFIKSAMAQTTELVWKDEITVTLAPGQGAEVKLTMKKGAVAEFDWTVEGGVANFDLHGDGAGKSISYKKGRGVPGESGSLKAAFDGNHGWFWRNRTKQDVNVTLRVRGDYTVIKRML